MNYERVKKNWTTGLWNLAALKAAYAKGVITKDQYKEIKALPQDGAEGDHEGNYYSAEIRELENNLADAYELLYGGDR